MALFSGTLPVAHAYWAGCQIVDVHVRVYPARVVLGPGDAANNHFVALIAPPAGATMFGLDDLSHVAEVVALALRSAQQVAFVVHQPAYGYRCGIPHTDEWFSVWSPEHATTPRGYWPRLSRAELEQLTGPLPTDGEFVIVSYPEEYTGPEPRPRTIAGGPFATYQEADAAWLANEPPAGQATFVKHTSELSPDEQRQLQERHGACDPDACHR